MTDDERQELIINLQNYRPPKHVHPAYGTALHLIAAEEIERLAKELLIEKGALEICQGELNMAFDKIEQLVKELHISNKALSMCSDECNRCYERAERSDARLTERIEQLEKVVEASGRM
jgi:hypothetical protein